jgi:hypothetical protein
MRDGRRTAWRDFARPRSYHCQMMALRALVGALLLNFNGFAVAAGITLRNFSVRMGRTSWPQKNI